jgi:hypothetical protein
MVYLPAHDPESEHRPVMLLIAFGASATAVVNALILRGTERYGWTGFAIFSGGYLRITLGPLLNAPYNSHLGTTAVLNYVQSKVAFASPSQPAASNNPFTRRASLVQRIATLELFDRRRHIRRPSESSFRSLLSF